MDPNKGEPVALKRMSKPTAEFDQFILEKAKQKYKNSPNQEYLSPQIVDQKSGDPDSGRSNTVLELETVRRNHSNNTRPKY